MPGIARIDIDSASDQMLISGASTIFINNRSAAIVGTINAAGASVINGSLTVFFEGHGVAREGDLMSDGQTITTSDQNCSCS